MADRRAFWQVGLVVGVIGGVLAGTIGTIFRSLAIWLFPSIVPYSSPDLVVHSLIAICVGYGLQPMVKRCWVLSGLVLSCTMCLMMLAFPISAHSLPPFHWSVFTVLPSGLAGMALREGVGGA